MTITKEDLVFSAVYITIFLVFARWLLAISGFEISAIYPLVVSTLLLLTASNFYLVNLFRTQKVAGKVGVYLGTAIFGALLWIMIVASLRGNPPLLLALFFFQAFGFYFMPLVFAIILGSVFGVQNMLWTSKCCASRKREKLIFLSNGLVWTICLFALPGLSWLALGSPFLGD